MPDRVTGHEFRLVSGGLRESGDAEGVLTARCTCGAWILVLTMDDAHKQGLTTWGSAFTHLKSQHQAHADARDRHRRQRVGPDYY